MEYIDRFKRRSTLHGTTNKERYLNQAKDNFNKYLSQAPNTFNATVRSKTFTVAVLDVSEINKESDEKYITTSFDSDIVIGDIVEIEDNDILTTNTWLVYDRENLVIASHKKFKIKPTNYLLKYINNGTIYESPIVKTYQTMYSIGLQSDKYLTTGSAKMSIIITDNENTRKLTRGNRIIIDDKVWKITNDESHDGYLKFTCDEDEFSDNDDLLNGIADRWSSSTPKPNYTFDMPDLITITRGAVASLNYLIKNNGITVTNPSLTVTVANTSVSTYNSTNNVFNGLIVGTTAATITFHGLDKDYTFTVNIRVVLTTVGDVITYSVISSDTSIKGESTFAVPKYITKTFYCQKYINGVMTDGTYNVGYTFSNADSTKVQIAINNGSVDITNLGNTSGSINFTFTDNVTKTVTLKTITFVA